MNANELADIVDYWAYKESAEYLTDAATMLRQQQEKITKYELRNIAQCDRIAILEAQLKKAQELTDEEIEELREYHGINDWLYETSITDFARAILRKAQEK